MEISLKKKTNTLLIGNGICRAMKMDSSDGIILNELHARTSNISEDDIKQLPFTMKVVVASGDHVDEFTKKLAKQFEHVEMSSDNIVFVSEMFKANINAILTTNYSYELEQAVFSEFSSYHYRKYSKKTTDKGNNKIRLFQYTDLTDKGMNIPIWHIHGEAFRPNGMIFGHYYYGKLIKEIQNYIPRLIMRRKYYMSSGKATMPVYSWVDNFMLSDVHITGFGMDLAESDLWWLICCKKRNFPDTEVYFYEPSEKEIERNINRKLLMDTYGIHTISQINFDKVEDPNKYKEFYINKWKSI